MTDNSDSDGPIYASFVDGVLQRVQPAVIVMQAEEFAALPDCEHCEGTGKQLPPEATP